MNYWRLAPIVIHRFEQPNFPAHALGELVTLVQYGCSALAKSQLPGTPILRMNNIQDDGWDLSELKYIELSDRDLATYRLEPGDILFNRTNSKELVGKCEVFREAGEWVFASYLIRVRADTNKLLPQFASDFLSTNAGRMQIDQSSRQIIGMTNINSEEIRQLRIPLSAANENQFFYLTFSQYVGLNQRPEIKLPSLLSIVRDSQSYEVFREELLRAPIAHENDAVLLAGLKERMDAIEAMRNCVAHNRRPHRRTVENYENALPLLNQMLDTYLGQWA